MNNRYILIWIFALLIGPLFSQQIVLPGQIVPSDPADTYSLVNTKYIQGSMKNVQSYNDLYSLSVERMDLGMLASVADSSYRIYQLKSIDPVMNWEELTATPLDDPEVDPIFLAWDRKTGITIEESQIIDLDHFEPTSLIVDYGFTDNSSNWNEAYNWGNPNGQFIPYIGQLIQPVDINANGNYFKITTGSTVFNVTTSGVEFTGGIYLAPSSNIPTGRKGSMYVTDAGVLMFHNGTQYVDISSASGNPILADVDASDTTRWGAAETDPIFSTWDKSTGISITESQISNLNHFSPTTLIGDYGFTDNSTNWNEAYGWGNHAGLYIPYIGQLIQPIDINANGNFIHMESPDFRWIGWDYDISNDDNLITKGYADSLYSSKSEIDPIWIADSSDFVSFSDMSSPNQGLGWRVLNNNTTGLGNTGFGYGVMQSSNSNYNAGFANAALWSLTSGYNNSAFGNSALAFLSTGSNNAGFGRAALYYLTDGFNNVAVGASAGQNLHNGTSPNSFSSNSVYIGAGTESLNITTDHEIVIGAGAHGKGTNTAVVGNADLTDFWVGDDGGATVHAANFESSGGTLTPPNPVLQNVTASDTTRWGDQRLYNKSLTAGENNINVGFTINSSSLIIYNGQPLKTDQWAGIGTSNLNIVFEVYENDFLVIKQ